MNEATNTSEQYEEKPNRDPRLTKAARILFGALAVCCIVCFILTGFAKFITAAVLCILVGFIKNIGSKKGLIDRIIAAAIVLIVMFGIAPLGISSHALWRYPFQRSYIGCYRNVKEPEWFPDFRSDVVSDYRFEYMASVMQGSGYYTVMFTAAPARAAEYAAEFSARAEYILPLNDYNNAYDKMLKAETALGNADEFGSLSLYAPGGFFEYWDGCPDARIYVIDAVLHPNHPHTSAVVIDETTGRIQLLEC